MFAQRRRHGFDHEIAVGDLRTAARLQRFAPLSQCAGVDIPFQIEMGYCCPALLQPLRHNAPGAAHGDGFGGLRDRRGEIERLRDWGGFSHDWRRDGFGLGGG